jgi:GNAT superfamily N-acetyltransferase
MRARPLLKQDYDEVVGTIDKWSGGPSAVLAHPVFFHELGELAKVVEHEGTLVGFLFGFLSARDPSCGYIHLVGIHPEFRRRGIGRLLHECFEQDCRSRGCSTLRAITLPGNDNVVLFHQSLGWSSNLVEDYAGPGRPRILFEKRL